MNEWMATNNDSRCWNVYEKAADGSWVGVAVVWDAADVREIVAVPELMAVLKAAEAWFGAKGPDANGEAIVALDEAINAARAKLGPTGPKEA